MSYWSDRDPREIIVAVMVVTVAALCYVAYWMAQTAVLTVIR